MIKKKIHIKKGDQVKVLSGKKKGFLGIINSVLKKKSSVILEGILPRIKYIKKSKKNENEELQKIKLPILIHISNVMLWDKTIQKSSRTGYKMVFSEKSNKLEKKKYFKKSGTFVL
jgi:large subunit ribosomal protein L24